PQAAFVRFHIRPREARRHLPLGRVGLRERAGPRIRRERGAAAAAEDEAPALHGNYQSRIERGRGVTEGGPACSTRPVSIVSSGSWAGAASRRSPVARSTRFAQTTWPVRRSTSEQKPYCTAPGAMPIPKSAPTTIAALRSADA